ncbi:MAG TPA: hypothetical protein PLP69_03530, partial [Bacteroidales bacterium]|nr:hypothetical protein [Bacteroidales bacterium]
MAKERKHIPTFDDIVFEKRNKEYGAFDLRKKYKRNVTISTAIGIVIIGAAVIIPYIRAKNIAVQKMRDANEVVADMANNLQQEAAAPPPPPPPPPPTEQVAVVKYVAPVVVDTVKPEDHTLASTDEQVSTTSDEQVTEIKEEVHEEVQEEAPQEVFVVVEEMPSFPGGDIELLKFISENLQYPEIAKENNIQGKV